MHLTWLDWLIVVLSLVLSFAPAFLFGKRSGKSTAEFFVSGRSVPWWLAGLSMVATTFSSSTPNLVTDIVRRQGVAGNWAWWAFALTGVATIFFYAQLWRRSGVMTDLEFYELRYSGRAAKAVRGFRAIYLGLFFNCLIMASVNLAACKIANILFGISMWQTILMVGLLNVVFAAYSGLWGVLIIDMVQFFLKMSAVIAAAYFVVKLPQIGGMAGLVEKVSALKVPGGIDYLGMMPDFANQWDIAFAVFIMPVAVLWWSVWYPGSEPGGGSYVAQRMLASKSEKDALASVLFFNIAHYVLRPWPWIIVALASLIIYPELSDIQAAFPNVDPKLVNHDIAYPAMLRFLPVGFAGLMIGGLIAANSSTILTHLNWGASYLVHDFYQRFVHRGATDAHYVVAARVATVLLFVVSCALTPILDSAKQAFDIMLQVGAGTGMIYLLRWFWWRITAWSEVVAMVVSFLLSTLFFILHRSDLLHLSTNVQLLITSLLTTVSWLLAAYFGPQTDEKQLLQFYLKVRPPGPGWARIRALLSEEEANAPALGSNIPLALLGWVLGCAVIWSALFALGNFLYGRNGPAILLGGICLLTTFGLISVTKHLWRASPQEQS